MDRVIYAAAVADPDWGGIIKELEKEVEDLNVGNDELMDDLIEKDNIIKELEEKIKDLEAALDNIIDTAKQAL